jgi:hypothetical protein
LNHRGRIKKTIKKVERVVGIEVIAKCEKNKIALPYRECEFQIHFGSGINSLDTSLEWLKDIGKLDDVIDEKLPDYKKKLNDLSDDEYWEETKRVDDFAKQVFKEIDDSFLENTRRKY